jgi:hypothetical protein
VKSSSRERITVWAPLASAGARTSARSGSTSRAREVKSIFVVIAVSSLSATAFCTEGSAAIGPTVST